MINCVVPFCDQRRAPENGATEWICGDHWKQIPKTARQVWGRYAGKWRRFGPPPDASAIAARVWASLKRRAIERSVGL